jgi:hypothetical protein
LALGGCFRDVKQFLGFEDPQSRVAKATTRTAPLIFFIYDLALLWYAQPGYQLAPKSTLARLWYPQKDSVSFEDILRTLRHATWQERIFGDPLWMRTLEKSSNPLSNGRQR